MNQKLRIMLLFMLVLFLPRGVHSQTTATSSAIDPAVADLAGRLSTSLHNAGVKRVVVFDLHGPQKEIHPVGIWLADQLSSALQVNSADLEVIERSKVRGRTETDKNSPANGAPGKEQLEMGRAVGADSVVRGSYAKISQRLGITLYAAKVFHSQPFIPPARGVVPISEEINGLSREPIPSFNGDVLLAGIGGITIPTCIRCPNPSYTDKARKEKYQGSVSLEVEVTADGRVDKAIVIHGPGLGLEENSIRAIKGWKFKPAEDLDDKPVAARVPIEVTFRLY